MRIFFLSFTFISAASLFAQQAEEKFFLSLGQDTVIESSASHYDASTGAFIVKAHAKGSDEYFYITRQGRSRTFTARLFLYTSVFDNSGNVYSVGKGNNDKNVLRYYLLKNNEVIGDYNRIDSDFPVINNTLYILVHTANETDKLLGIDLKTGEIAESKEYSNIEFFTDYNDLKPFTRLEEPVFLGRGNFTSVLFNLKSEQEFNDRLCISWFFKDKAGNNVFIARRGDGKEFIMQGARDYPVVGLIKAPVLFDSLNRPVIVVNHRVHQKLSTDHVLAGDDMIGIPYSLIYSLQITPKNEIAFIGSTLMQDEQTYISSAIVISGEEVKTCTQIKELVFTPDNVPVYTADMNGSGKYDVFAGDKKIDSGYTDILNLKILPRGNNSYLGFRSSSEFVFSIGGKKYGPYYNYTAFMMGPENYLQADSAGNYAFISSEKYGNNYGDGLFYNSAYLNGKRIEKDFYSANYMKLLGTNVIVSAKSKGETNAKYTLWCNGKAVSNEYDEITDFHIDTKTNTLNSIGINRNELFYLEIKF